MGVVLMMGRTPASKVSRMRLNGWEAWQKTSHYEATFSDRDHSRWWLRTKRRDHLLRCLIVMRELR